MEPRPSGLNSRDVCFGDWGCVESQHQWEKDHPNGKISKWEQEAMDQYVEDSRLFNEILRDIDEEIDERSHSPPTNE